MSTTTNRTNRNKTLVWALIGTLVVLLAAWVITLNIAFFWVALAVLVFGVGAINGLSRK